MATSYFMYLRRLIAIHLLSYRLSVNIEAKEIYFGRMRKINLERGTVEDQWKNIYDHNYQCMHFNAYVHY